MRVQHRHIIYIQGYDPRGLAQYYRMFRTELRKFARLYSSPPPSAGRRAPPTARSRPGPSRPRRRLADPHQLRFPALGRFHPARPRRADLAHGVPRGVDLLAAGLRRHHRPVLAANWRFATFITYPHFLLLLEAIVRRRRSPSRCGKGLEALGIPDLFSMPAAAAVFVAMLGTAAEIHRKPDLSALSAVRHDLDLAILAPPAAGMGRAHRPFCPASRRGRAAQRRRGNRHRRPQFGIVSGRRNPGARAEARSRRSAGTARASCCSRSAAISRSSVSTPASQDFRDHCASWRSSRRSTGSTARRART